MTKHHIILAVAPPCLIWYGYGAKLSAIILAGTWSCGRGGGFKALRDGEEWQEVRPGRRERGCERGAQIEPRILCK